jgi:hypothetical protein
MNENIPRPFRFVITATASTAHGEAGANSTGPNNTTLFARELTLLNSEQLSFSASEAKAALKGLLAQFPMANEHFAFLSTLSGPQLLAVIFAAQFPLLYGGEGAGLFAGMERYQYLTTRLADAAVSFSILPDAWGYVARKLALPMYPESAYRVMTAIFTMPKAIQAASLAAILKSPELIVMSARMIAEGIKASNPDYAKKAKTPQTEVGVYILSEPQAADVTAEGKSLSVRLPAISGNSLRHNLLREPATTRLLTELGLTPDRNLVPIGVERFLYSGGNTQKGAKAPAASDVYEAIARQRYPMIDALGGSTDQFVMTRSQIAIASWIVCREHNWITERKTDGEVRAESSVFDLMTETTRTRSGIGGKDAESGQMIYSYETLAAGTQILVEVGFQPFTSDLTIGSMLQALLDWQAWGGRIGARSNQGHSQFLADFPDDERIVLAGSYLEYLRTNREELAAGLTNATFGTEVKLCAA